MIIRRRSRALLPDARNRNFMRRRGERCFARRKALVCPGNDSCETRKTVVARKKILVVSLNYKPELSGIAPYTADLVSKLATDRSADVTVYTTHPHYPQWHVAGGYGQWLREEQDGRARILRFRHYVPSSPSLAKRLASEISFTMRIIRHRWDGFDLVISVSPSIIASAAAGYKARRHRAPFILWSQDLYYAGIRERRSLGFKVLGPIVRFSEGSVYRRADSVVAIHPRMQEKIQNELSVRPHKLKTIRNWSHLKPSPAAKTRDELRSHFGWEDQYVVVHLGAQGHKQGLAQFVEIADQVSAVEPRVHWVFVGDGSERNTLEALCAKAASVSVWDPLPADEFANILIAADLFLVCEINGGFHDSAVPSKLTTYFQAPSAVLAVANPRSITWHEVANAKAGVATIPERKDVLDAVRTLINNPALAGTLASNGQRFCDMTMSSERCLNSWQNLVYSHLGGPTPDNADAVWNPPQPGISHCVDETFS